jgi:hypothetical protein
MIGYQLPSVSRMRNKLIPSVMDKTRLEVMKILQASTSISIILDIRSSKNMLGFIGLTCMCVKKEFERRMVFLGVKKKMTERHTAENILAEFDQVLRDWNIPHSMVIKT